MEQFSYRTIKNRSEGLFKDRGSKFLAFAFPVTGEEQVKKHLEDLKREYHDARHHCYAWKLGTGPGLTRANDDGEPSNTAGKPILMQIQKHGLTNVLIVVVRYFGGVLLGTGGLINAYRTAAADAITQAEAITKTVNEQMEINFPYSAMNDVMRVLKEEQADQVTQEYGNDCTINITIPLEKSPRLKGRLNAIPGVNVKKLSNNY